MRTWFESICHVADGIPDHRRLRLRFACNSAGRKNGVVHRHIKSFTHSKPKCNGGPTGRASRSHRAQLIGRTAPSGAIANPLASQRDGRADGRLLNVQLLQLHDPSNFKMTETSSGTPAASRAIIASANGLAWKSEPHHHPLPGQHQQILILVIDRHSLPLWSPARGFRCAPQKIIHRLVPLRSSGAVLICPPA